MDFFIQAITEQFHMIESYVQPLIIPLDHKAERLINSLCRELLRKLQPYTVPIPEKALSACIKQGVSN